MKFRILAAAALLVLASAGLAAGAQSPGIKGITTSQQGAIRLAGVAVTVLDSQGRQVAAVQSGEDGQFTLPPISPGRYTIVTKLAGFREVKRTIDTLAGAIADLNLDLEPASSETVSVVVKEADSARGFASTLASREVVAARTAEVLPIGGESIQAALRVISSVTEQTGGVRIKGGRSDQSSLQFGRVIANDPTGGSGMFRLPVDAVDSIEVLPNPYGAEFGGFSSGLVVVHPRTPPQAWKVVANGWPSFITARNNPVHPVAVREFVPRIIMGGPVMGGRASLLLSAQARYRSDQIWSRPQSERRDTVDASVFARLDGKAGDRHALSATFGYFPSMVWQADLNTFTPPPATIDVDQDSFTFAVADAFQIRPTTSLETTVAAARFGSRSSGQGTATMVVTPDEILGNFYNDQNRSATTAQFSEALSAIHQGLLGQHFFKAGVDALYTDYSETSTSRLIEVRRSNGTLAETLSFDPSIFRRSRTTDAAAFAQDYWQLHTRLLVEAGVRLEYSDAFRATTVAPRAAATFAVKANGSAALRAGIGIFPERVPSAVDAFAQLGSQTETRYASNGVTLVDVPVVFAHAVAPDLQVPRSLTWNVEYDHRVTDEFSVRMNYLERRGSNELVVEPIRSGSAGQLLLSSNGRSMYREAEFAVRYTRDNVIDLAASYTRSESAANLNGYAAYYGLKRNPFVRSDAYAPTDVHSPNKFQIWTTVSVVRDWLFGLVGSVRNGFPYSAVDEYLDFSGPRNQGRAFPTAVSLDASVQWHVKFDRLARKLGRIGKLRPWIGFTLFNMLDSDLPIDVQPNLGSPNFGTFYNSPLRQFRISLRFRY